MKPNNIGETNEERISRLDQQTSDMAEDIKEIKDDIKTIKDDIVTLKVSAAKFGVYLIIGIAVIEFLLKHFVK